MDSGRFFSFVNGLYLDMHLFALHLLFDFKILNKRKIYRKSSYFLLGNLSLSLSQFFLFPRGQK